MPGIQFVCREQKAIVVLANVMDRALVVHIKSLLTDFRVSIMCLHLFLKPVRVIFMFVIMTIGKQFLKQFIIVMMEMNLP